MNDHHARILERGLAEFDKAVARRRSRRRAGIAAAVMLIVFGSYFLLPVVGTEFRNQNLVATAHRPLPAYVEVINDDAHLALELEVANACERVGRRGDRVYIVECNSSHEPGFDPLATP
ncbi:MAG: hypothetical protein K8R92_11435 [Planctomycetes bacterium]|nr:hypothetical protein [Planctomycetota bacterium]